MNLKLTEGKVQIMYEHGEASGIRDRTGYLMIFNKVSRYTDQPERYEREIAHKARLVDFLLNALNVVSDNGGNS